jgi:predicted DNA-binding transcriptional regulator YafY
MTSAIRNTARLILLLQQHPRISVRKLVQELQMSRSAVYRALAEVSKEIDLYLEDGVVRMVRR